MSGIGSPGGAGGVSDGLEGWFAARIVSVAAALRSAFGAMVSELDRNEVVGFGA